MSKLATVAYLGCSLSIGVFAAFNNFTLSLWLTTFTTSYFLIALLGNTRSFEGAVVSPVFGAWSDRVWAGWLGRRRPFILVGGLLSALILAFTPAITRWAGSLLPASLPAETALILPAIVAVFLFTLTFNTMDDVHGALMADLTEGAERNRLSALKVLVGMLGQVGILVVGFFLWRDGIPDSAFLVTGAIIACGVLVTVLGVREPAPAIWAPERAREAGAAPDSRLSLRDWWEQYRGAFYFFVVIFAYWSGVNAVLPLVSIYLRDILGASVGEAQLLPSLLLLSTTAMALPTAWLGTRYGKRRVLAAGYIVMGLAALAALFITTKEQGAIVFLLAGTGNAATMVLTLPILAELVPRRHIGLANGIQAAAGSVAAPLASLVAGLLAETFGPRAIFGLMAFMVLVALAFLPLVRRPRPAPGYAPAPTLSPQSA
ncbi:MAG TPA: MFS transporter [Chloroflexota bacterium]|nr:MFS transporter [Chloroflexota bacterium]